MLRHLTPMLFTHSIADDAKNRGNGSQTMQHASSSSWLSSTWQEDHSSHAQKLVMPVKGLPTVQMLTVVQDWQRQLWSPEGAGGLHSFPGCPPSLDHFQTHPPAGTSLVTMSTSLHLPKAARHKSSDGRQIPQYQNLSCKRSAGPEHAIQAFMHRPQVCNVLATHSFKSAL